MAMDSSECNGSGEAPKVELDAKAGVEFGSEKDLAKSDCIASNAQEVNDQDGIGGPFVIINGDSGNPSEKIPQLEGKANPDTTGEDKVSPSSPINADNEIAVKEVEEAELKCESVPAQGEPSLENSELGEKVEQKSMVRTENGELSENRENTLEFRGSAEKKGLSEETVVEEISLEEGKDQVLGSSGENKYSSEEPVVEEIDHGKGKECELSMATELEMAAELENKKDVNLRMREPEAINGKENGSELVSDSVKKTEEEHPLSGSVEGTDTENERMHGSETIVGEPDKHEELDISSTLEDQTPQEVEQDMSIASLQQVVHEESEALSDSPDTQKKAEMPVTKLEDPALDLAAEAESEQKHEVQQVAFPSEEIQDESQGASDSLQGNREVEMPETESKEQPLLDSAVGSESELNLDAQQEVSSPQEDEVHEESVGVSDSLQSNESDAPGTELNDQSSLDSAVKVESEQKHGEQQEVSSLTQEEEMHEETDKVPVCSEGKKEFMEAHETEVKEIPPTDVETESKEAHETIAETKIYDQDTVTTVCYGKENSESEASASPILVEMEKRTPGLASSNQEKLAESEAKQESDPIEAKDKSEAVVSDTVAEGEVPSESINEVEEMQNAENGDAASKTAEVSASPNEIEVAFRSVNGKELVESSSEVLPESENNSTSEVEEGDRSVTEFEDSPSKTEAETISVSSNDGSAREIGLDDSVQIGKFKISIAENGPAILQEEIQEGAGTTRAVAPEEPGTSTSNGEKPEVQPLKRQAIYLIKVPRYSDEEQWEKIQEAQARLDELTRTRDAIRDIMQKRRKACSDSWDEVVKAREEERAERAVFNAKRHEISTVQSVINKLNKANSIDDMDDLIEMKEKTLQHETMTLKQEKMLIQEIKELRAQRKKLIDNMGSAAEIDEAFDQKDSVFDKQKTLKTELEVLGKTLTKAEAKTRAAQKSYDEIDLSYCALQDEHKSADEVRQKAYLYWRDLKSELAKKNKPFFNYRDDQKRAASFLGNHPPDKEGVRLYCNRQVEKLMELWNNDAEFRKQYIESNKISTLRRLRTLDGRSLGPDEVPPIIPTTSTTYRRTSTPLVPAIKEIRPQRPTRVSSSPSVQSDEFPELPNHKPKMSPKNSKNDKAGSSKENVMDQLVVIDREAVVTASMENPNTEKKRDEDEMERRKREEVERARREEDIKRQAKAEAEEKERLREEQKAKAKEAEERKKRKAEKAQERAEFKSRREAEIRDKKRAKKDKKKVTGGESDNGDTTIGPSTESITPSEIAQIKDMPAAAAPTTGTRRPTRPQVALKQLKRVEPVPVALRNRGRRKMRSWIIGIVTAIAALLTVFFIGNYVNFSHISSLVWL